MKLKREKQEKKINKTKGWFNKIGIRAKLTIKKDKT